MLICPDCSNRIEEVKNLQCRICSWKASFDDKILNLFGKKDKDDLIFCSYLSNYDTIAQNDINKSIQNDNYIKKQANNLINEIGNLENKKIADIGSGKGFLVEEMINKGGRDIYAIDITSKYMKQFVNLNYVKLIMANAENLPFENEFDIITATDIMEHVINIGSFLYSTNRALKIGGQAFIRVPYLEDLMSYSPHNGCSYKFVHLRNFDKKILKYQISKAGFKIVKCFLDGFQYEHTQTFWENGKFRNIILQKIKSYAKNKKTKMEIKDFWSRNVMRIFWRQFEVCIVVEKHTNVNKSLWH
jgi:ubiquinone/menaquinone biosynthesis C-methylase UbiE